MAANRITTDTGVVDSQGEIMSPLFGPMGNCVTADSHWYARLVEDGEGSIPGRAEIVIGNSSGVVDEVANAVAWNPGGPTAGIRQGMDCQVIRYYPTKDQDGNVVTAGEIVFAGKVDITEEERAEGIDQLVCYASDVRTELRKVRVTGRVICTAGGGTQYYQSWPCHFNPGGRPNCIFDSQGRPWFSPYPDYGAPGYADAPNGSNSVTGEIPPNASAQDTSQSCYWTLATIMQYLRNVYGPNAPTPSSLSTTFAYYPFLLIQCPSYLNWPDTFASNLDTEISANFNSGIGQNITGTGTNRKGPDVNINGLFLCGLPGKEGAFDVIFAKTGGWTWTITYTVDDASGSQTGTAFGVINTLATVPNRYFSAQSAVDVSFAAGGPAASTLNTFCIHAGTIRKSSQNTITRSVGLASLIKFETLLDSTPSGNGLIVAWQAARLTSFLNAWITYGGDETAFNLAASQYPEVLTTIELDPNFNFQAAEFISRPRAPISRPIWPYLLSYQGNKSGAVDSATQPYPIRVEADITGSGGWSLVTEFGMQDVRDNGQIYIPAMRDLPIKDPSAVGSWRWASGKGLPIQATSDIVVNYIRFTAAIPSDERLMYAIRTAQDTKFLTQNQLSAAVPFFDTTDDCPDSGELDPSFSRTNFLELHTLYERWVQNNSWPIPGTVSGATAQNNATLRDDHLQLQSHVRRDLKQGYRLERDGTDLRVFGTFITTLTPGMMIGNLTPRGVTGGTPYALNGIVSRRRYTSNPTNDRQGNPSWKNQTSILVR